MTGVCFECDADGEVHDHHVVPRSRGGTRKIPLCIRCHGLVHGIRMSHSLLTREGLDKARQRGVRLGSHHPAVGVAKAVAANRVKAAQYATWLAPHIEAIRSAGIVSLRGIATALNQRGILSPRGRRFHAQTVANLLYRLSVSQQLAIAPQVAS